MKWGVPRGGKDPPPEATTKRYLDMGVSCFPGGLFFETLVAHPLSNDMFLSPFTGKKKGLRGQSK